VVSFYEAISCKLQLWKYRLSATESFKRQLKKTDIAGVESTGNTRYFVDQIERHTLKNKQVFENFPNFVLKAG